MATAPNEWSLAERLVSGPALRATRPFVDLQSDSDWLLGAKSRGEELELAGSPCKPVRRHFCNSFRSPLAQSSARRKSLAVNSFHAA